MVGEQSCLEGTYTVALPSKERSSSAVEDPSTHSRDQEEEDLGSSPLEVALG